MPKSYKRMQDLDITEYDQQNEEEKEEQPAEPESNATIKEGNYEYINYGGIDKDLLAIHIENFASDIEGKITGLNQTAKDKPTFKTINQIAIDHLREINKEILLCAKNGTRLSDQAILRTFNLLAAFKIASMVPDNGQEATDFFNKLNDIGYIEAWKLVSTFAAEPAFKDYMKDVINDINKFQDVVIYPEKHVNKIETQSDFYTLKTSVDAVYEEITKKNVERQIPKEVIKEQEKEQPVDPNKTIIEKGFEYFNFGSWTQDQRNNYAIDINDAIDKKINTLRKMGKSHDDFKRINDFAVLCLELIKKEMINTVANGGRLSNNAIYGARNLIAIYQIAGLLKNKEDINVLGCLRKLNNLSDDVFANLVDNFAKDESITELMKRVIIEPFDLVRLIDDPSAWAKEIQSPLNLDTLKNAIEMYSITDYEEIQAAKKAQEEQKEQVEQREKEEEKDNKDLARDTLEEQIKLYKLIIQNSQSSLLSANKSKEYYEKSLKDDEAYLADDVKAIKELDDADAEFAQQIEEFADSLDDVTREYYQNELDDNQLKRLEYEKSIKKYEEEVKSYKQQISEIDQRISEIHKQLKESEEKLTIYEEKLKLYDETKNVNIQKIQEEPQQLKQEEIQDNEIYLAQEEIKDQPELVNKDIQQEQQSKPIETIEGIEAETIPEKLEGLIKQSVAALEAAKTWYNSAQYKALIQSIKDLAKSDGKTPEEKLRNVADKIDKYIGHKAQDGVNANVYKKLAAVQQADIWITKELSKYGIKREIDYRCQKEYEKIDKDELTDIEGRYNIIAQCYDDDKITSDFVRNADHCLCRIILKAEDKNRPALINMRREFNQNETPKAQEKQKQNVMQK